MKDDAERDESREVMLRDGGRALSVCVGVATAATIFFGIVAGMAGDPTPATVMVREWIHTAQALIVFLWQVIAVWACVDLNLHLFHGRRVRWWQVTVRGLTVVALLAALGMLAVEMVSVSIGDAKVSGVTHNDNGTWTVTTGWDADEIWFTLYEDDGPFYLRRVRVAAAPNGTDPESTAEEYLTTHPAERRPWYLSQPEPSDSGTAGAESANPASG